MNSHFKQIGDSPFAGSRPEQTTQTGVGSNNVIVSAISNNIDVPTRSNNAELTTRSASVDVTSALDNWKEKLNRMKKEIERVQQLPKVLLGHQYWICCSFVQLGKNAED